MHNNNNGDVEFNVEIATKYSVLKSVILEILKNGIQENLNNNYNLIDGYCWYCISYSDLQKILPFISISTIKYNLNKLYDKKIIDRRQLYKRYGDTTYCYTIIDNDIRNILDIKYVYVIKNDKI